MVLKQFSSIYMLHTRFGGVWNCRVLKHQKIKEPLFCKEAKLHGAQALQPLKITNVQVWKKIKLQGSQTCYCAAKTKKLQGTQTFTGWSLRQQRVWQKIKLHDSQTFSLLFPLWRRAKLHGSQTAVQTLTGFDGVWNYMVFKHRCRRRNTIFGFGEE